MEEVPIRHKCAGIISPIWPITNFTPGNRSKTPLTQRPRVCLWTSWPKDKGAVNSAGRSSQSVFCWPGVGVRGCMYTTVSNSSTAAQKGSYSGWSYISIVSPSGPADWKSLSLNVVSNVSEKLGFAGEERSHRRKVGKGVAPEGKKGKYIAPLRPNSLTARRSSCAACLGSCILKLANPENRLGFLAHCWAI